MSDERQDGENAKGTSAGDDVAAAHEILQSVLAAIERGELDATNLETAGLRGAFSVLETLIDGSESVQQTTD